MNSLRNIFMVLIVIVLLSCEKEENDKLFIPNNIVIAHRGSTFYTPEETEAAYRWARNIGADYLEVDIQRSKDGVLLALHDETLLRTTNVISVFGDSNRIQASEYTYEELMFLDAGVWFNIANPEQAKLGFTPNKNHIQLINSSAISFHNDGTKSIHPNFSERVYINGKQYISTLEDVIRIAEGYCIARDSDGQRLYKKKIVGGEAKYEFFYTKDPADNANRPGVYIETKEPQHFPNIEKDLFAELHRLNWNQLTKPVKDTNCFKDGKVNIGGTSAKIILQTFSIESLKKLQMEFEEQIPVCFLLWLGDANMPANDSITYYQNLEIAHQFGAQIIGPSIGGAPNHYSELLSSENFQWINNEGFTIHPYSFDTQKQTEIYGERCSGMFTNRAEITIQYYQENGKRNISTMHHPEQVLMELGY